MTRVVVWHCDTDRRFSTDSAVDWPHGFQKVAEFYTAMTGIDALEQAFRWTNSFDKPWFDQGVVRALIYPCRSTSVGDVVVLDTQAWVVAPVGWEPIPFKES